MLAIGVSNLGVPCGMMLYLIGSHDMRLSEFVKTQTEQNQSYENPYPAKWHYFEFINMFDGETGAEKASRLLASIPAIPAKSFGAEDVAIVAIFCSSKLQRPVNAPAPTGWKSYEEVKDLEEIPTKNPTVGAG
jgi:hypothetical protein